MAIQGLGRPRLGSGEHWFPQGFVTVEPSSELGLPYLKLLFGETLYWELGWGVYFSNWHDEAG